MTTPQDAAADEAEGVETVTFTWDDDEWTIPAFDALTADQMAAVEQYADQPLSVRHARSVVREVLDYDDAASFGWNGLTKATDILETTAELFAAMAEAWGLGKASNRKERRSGRTTKR